MEDLNGESSLPVREQVPAVAMEDPPVVPSQTAPAGISADEIALYDRQIRLWGVQAQEKIRSASILLITLSALSNEIAKNLVLAGISTLTILDSAIVTEADLGAQFFLSQADVGRNRAEAAAPQIRKLNPRVKVVVDTTPEAEVKSDYYSQFDVVIAIDLAPMRLGLINTMTRFYRKRFYAAGLHGMYGFIFSDLIEHDYLVEREKGNRPTTLGQETRSRSVVNVSQKKENGKNIELVTKREEYATWILCSDGARLPEEFLKSRRRLKAVTPILSCFRALWAFLDMNNGRFPSPSIREDIASFTLLATAKHKALGLPEETMKSEVLRKFLGGLNTEISPVAAVLGGQLAQDVINVLGARQQPIQNTVIFDGDTMESPMFVLHPDGEELGTELLATSNVNMDNGLVMNGAPLPVVPGVPVDSTVIA
ncbi:Activating enzyme of the ubiquitin-like protein [Glarea lozoyensis ATCC 20868]|uniref:Ubiquitin-like 1-activating enzyme E1A n=1 Tax=Glarea lozoyensis (strain ATCC 20868 / MF5171) TaxID=1116229 RepID=S3DEC2_GLAL2|nr:Activating enzyme of the ubiquitin-like protein [Glarea lozoyensis ATCC 20868]EPE35459.1 Activating enzyme of the ubiquitin-like protein [Glarea lozoyensis ATCC 20868]